MKKLNLILLTAILTSFSSAAFAGYVRGYYKDNGTYVAPHQRSAPDGNPNNNYSSPGQYNPNKGAYNSY
jgi:hypothetical protein